MADVKKIPKTQVAASKFDNENAAELEEDLIDHEANPFLKSNNDTLGITEI